MVSRVVTDLPDQHVGGWPVCCSVSRPARLAPGRIGFALTAGTVSGLLAPLPGGELLDRMRSKTIFLAVGIRIIGLSALMIGLSPSFPVVLTAVALQGVSAATIGLGIPGHQSWPFRDAIRAQHATGAHLGDSFFFANLTAALLGAGEGERRSQDVGCLVLGARHGCRGLASQSWSRTIRELV
jgi:MFS family permease